MSTELREILARIEKIAVKDHEMGHVLKSIVAYLATMEEQQTRSLKGSGKHAN